MALSKFVRVIPQHGELLDNSYKVFEVTGVSMYPTLNAGAQILVRKVSRSEWHKITGVIIVIIGDERLIKRVPVNTLNNTTRLELLSDNPKFGSITVHRDEIKELYKAIRIINEPII